jgi:2'-5' RNA ligase
MMAGSDNEARTLRLFVAIALPETVKDEVEKIQRELRGAASGDSIRWAKREQFHLTLKFLGNVAETGVNELIEALRAACANFGPLHLRAEGVGFFPDARFPRVAWVGVGDSCVLPELQKKIEAAVERFTSEKPDKQFVGHVTLARIQRIKRPHAEAWAKSAEDMSKRRLGEWVAAKVGLIRSELGVGGSRYTTLAEFPLLGGGCNQRRSQTAAT